MQENKIHRVSLRVNIIPLNIVSFKRYFKFVNTEVLLYLYSIVKRALKISNNTDNNKK